MDLKTAVQWEKKRELMRQKIAPTVSGKDDSVAVEKNGLKNEARNKLPLRETPINKKGDFLGIRGYENSTRDLVSSKMPKILRKLSTLHNTTSRIL